MAHKVVFKNISHIVFQSAFSSKLLFKDHPVYLLTLQNTVLHLITIPVELGFLWEFELLKLKTCSLHHENLFTQKFKVISNQVLNNILTALDIMEAVKGRFHFYGMIAI